MAIERVVDGSGDDPGGGGGPVTGLDCPHCPFGKLIRDWIKPDSYRCNICHAFIRGLHAVEDQETRR